MKTKKLTPRNSAPVKRENTATVARDGNAIAPLSYHPVRCTLCGRRRRVIPLIIARTSNHVKSLFLLARVRGLPL
jgi:prenylated cyclic peptide (anacyclamide/piricyclamide family)